MTTASARRRADRHRVARRLGDDRDAGVVGAIEMLFLSMIMLAVFLFLVEVTAYWHVHNVLEEAAAQGAQVASAFDGDCAQATDAAVAVASRGGGWTKNVRVTCSAQDPVRVSVTASSPALLFGATDMTVAVSTPSVKEQ